MPLRAMPIQQPADDHARLARGERLVRVHDLPGPMFGEAEERRSRDWHDQSLACIAARLGFDAVEATCILTGVPFEQATWDVETAHRMLLAMKVAFERGRNVVREARVRMEATPMTPRVLAYAQAALRADLAAALAAEGDERDARLADLKGLAPQLGLDLDTLRSEPEADGERSRAPTMA